MQSSIEFASSEDDPPVEGLDLGAAFSPDGSPLDEETELLNELQQVQRDIAHRRLERKRRLEQQLALARQQLQAEEQEDAVFSAAVRVPPPQNLATSTNLGGWRRPRT